MSRTSSLAPAPLRVVLDTNVVLSALIFNNAASQALREAWRGGRLIPCACTATVQELMRVLAYPKFRLSASAQHELLADFLPYVQVVHMPDPPPAVPTCRDPHDEVFMQLALVANAEALVSGDKDLLALATNMALEHQCPVWTLQQLLTQPSLTTPAAAAPTPRPPTKPAQKTPAPVPGRPARRQ
jgi:putative PIN family toxin of toxin-antitoxin system